MFDIKCQKNATFLEGFRSTRCPRPQRWSNGEWSSSTALRPWTYDSFKCFDKGYFFSCPGQLNRWPCHSLTHSVSDSPFDFSVSRAVQSCCRPFRHYSDTTVTLQWHFSDTSVTLQWHYSDTTVTLQWHYSDTTVTLQLSLIHIWRCRRSTLCRSRWSPYH